MPSPGDRGVKPETLGAVRDFLEWIGLDRDGHRSDWSHWLYREVSKGIEAYNHRANLRGDCTLRLLCILPFVILPGESVETPVANVLVFRWQEQDRRRLGGPSYVSCT